MKTLPLVLALLAATTLGAAAQEHAGHGAPAVDLPEICTRDAAAAGHGSMAMDDMSAMLPSDAHRDLMAGMDAMNGDMMVGGMAADLDVAFICSMIPHHRGAVDMAKAVLAHGDDPWAKSLAEGIIAAQEKEIADMLAWLDRQS